MCTRISYEGWGSLSCDIGDLVNQYIFHKQTVSLRYKIFSTCTVEVDKDSVNNPDCHSPHAHCLIAIPIYIHNCEYYTHSTEKIHYFSQCSQIVFLCHCFSVLKLYLDNTIKGFSLFASFSFCVTLYRMLLPVPRWKNHSLP